uniref:Uncharacterized protein n=2 Tax=Lutzomyia longipalpis TaxID=7200 RepID=A0A1B0CGV6_LUTLO
MLKLPKGLKKKKKGKNPKRTRSFLPKRSSSSTAGSTRSRLPPLSLRNRQQQVLSTRKRKPQSRRMMMNGGSSMPLQLVVDSILKKTQGDLDRIKSTSFFQRVPPPSEKQKKAAEEVKHEEGAEEAQQPAPAEEVAEEKDNLAAAVIELSESESESEEADDIFDTTYIDVITTNELPLAYIPDSPVQDEDDGPDPFDTTYAEKVIKGPEVSKKGKKIVSIGSAVEVLTGRVETVASTVSTKRPRRGVQNLLLEDAPTAEEATAGAEVKASSPVVVKTLLDDNDDVLPDIPIDLSVSLHLTLQKEKAEKESQGSENKERDVLAEFDELKPSEPDDDEFAQLATESLTKVEEVTKVVHRDITPSVEVSSDWAAFEEQQATEGAKGKPSRPPPPRPAAAPQVSHLITNQELDLEEEADDVDPFDTAFVDKVVLVDDDEFDPRAEGKEEEAPAQVVPASEDELFSPDFPKEENLFPPRDYLGGSYSDLSTLPDVAIAPAAARPKTPEEFDPFDTSAVSSVVVPKEVELKFLERELLADNTPAPLPPPVNPLAKLKPSLSDPDFDPRGLGEEENPPSKQTAPKAIESRSSVDIQSRKSSLSLNIQTSSPKAVSFVVPTPDLLAVGENGGKIQKPLTPYYNKEVIIPPSEDVDPFDTSFVSEIKPTQVELSLLESDLLNQQQQQQQQYPAVQLDEDSDFDPRADSPTPAPVKPRVKTPDLLAVGEEIDIKVLTPAVEIANAAAEVPTFDDPFDTSGVDSNILPGKVELKLIENELLPHLAKTPEPVLDILSYSQDDSLPVKALTPLGAVANSVEVEDIDPFDTSIAENLGPGKTEIKLIESELIGQDHPSSAAYSNPFLMSDAADDEMDYAAENPFFGQIPPAARNPFAEFDDAAQEEPIPNNINMYSTATMGVVTTGMQLFMGADVSASVTTTAANTFQPVSSGVNIFAEDPSLAQKPMDLDIKQAALSNAGRRGSGDSDDAPRDFNVVIKPREGDVVSSFMAAALAPPPKSGANSTYSGDSSPRVNPFDKGYEEPMTMDITPETKPTFERTDSQETPPTPLFDEDVSQPLEDFPRIMLFNSPTDKEPFQELPLQACYSVSEIGAQQYDQFGKIFTVKLQYIFYKERPGVRPGQVTKAERLTNKLSQFAAYAIQGDYQGVKEFGSDLKKLGLPVEHAPQVSQLFKIGSMNYEDMKQFSVCVEEALFKLHAHRDRALTYKSEEVQITAVDELYAEQDSEGHVMKQIARVRLFFLGFLSGMPSIELGVNDLWRQGKEVVGRHDIIPVVTEEWIRLEGVEFHNCVQQDEYERTRTIKFQPPDACYIELMRFRVRPPKNRELPLQIKATWCVTGNRVELRVDVLVPGFASRKLGQIPCEDKHFRYGSVKSAHRRTGKIKGIERILGTVDQLQGSLIEVTSGQAKYEHHHRSIVWRCPRLPKEGQGAYTTHQMVCRMALTSYEQIPEQLAPYCYVEFTMPATQVSHTTVRSVSVQESDSDEPPEKYVRYLARHEYRVGIEHTTGESQNPYLAATAVSKPNPIKEEPPAPALSPMAPSDSDSDSN